MVREVMTVREFLLRMLVAVQPVLPVALAVLAVTLAAAAGILVRAEGLWVDQKRFRWLGVFYALDGGDRVRLACAWLKLALLPGLLARFQRPDAVGGMVFLLPALLGVLMTKERGKLPGNLLWLAVETAALVSCGLVCGFYREVHSGAGVIVLYVLMALFTALLGVYLFLVELSDISRGRRAHIHE